MEALKEFGFLFAWAIGSTIAACLCTGLMALIWIPMVNWMFRYNDRLRSSK